MNLYGFAGGDPVNHSDPFGLSPDCTTAPQLCLTAAAAAQAAGLAALGAVGAAVFVVYQLDRAFGSSGGAMEGIPAAGARDATATFMGRSTNRIPIVGGPPNTVVTRPGISIEYGPDGNAVTRTCAKAGHGCDGAHTHEYTTGPNGKVNQKGKPRPATEEEKNRTPPPNDP
jgi:hypothetical protein